MDVAQGAIDACTLNNALNIAQLAVLVALLRWVRDVRPQDARSRPPITPSASNGDRDRREP